MEQREKRTNDWPNLRPSPDTINHTPPCLQTGAEHNCPLRGPAQQRVKTDAETHSRHQAELGEALGRAGGGTEGPHKKTNRVS